MCDCFHLAFPNWHAASSGTGAGRRLQGAEPGTEDGSVCDEPSQFTEGERPRPQGSSPVEEFPEKYSSDSDLECVAEHDPQRKSGSGKKSKKSGLGSMFEKRSTPKMSKLKEVHSPESGVIVKTAKDGCAEGLIYGGGGKEGIFIKQVVPESPASKSLKLKEGDQVLSATVYFDNVSYEDAIQILEHAQAYKVKLCLKRKPDTETEAAIDSDVIPEEDIYPPEMREQGKTKRRGDTRISWPKFPSFGKGRKSRFTRSHSSSEADEQRKLELSPTTSDTESPIKTQDALKGKKRHKMKLSALTKRGRISSSEDQDTDVPTTGQTSGDNYQTASDMLSPECLESLSGEAPEDHLTEDVKGVEDLRPEQNDQKITETGQHKVELISIDNTLKTADITVALANQESPPEVKSPSEKKKKKERSELKMKLLGKDKSHKKDSKAKASPKRLKTLGASLEAPDQPENEKSDVAPGAASRTDVQRDQVPLDANTQIISSEMTLTLPKVELDTSTLVEKSPKKGEEKTKKSKDTKQKQEKKTGSIFKLPKIGLTDITPEETIQQQQINAKVDECPPKSTEAKEDPYDKLSKVNISRTQLPKREEIEIPGMEDKSVKTTVKRIKEPKATVTGHDDDSLSETVQMSIDVDSVKEAVSKLPGFKVPKVDTSGMPIPEEITLIDANAQRITVKTPTKVVDTKAKHEAHFSEFDINVSSELSKTTIKLPKITADLTSHELLTETTVDLKRPEIEHKTKPKHSDKEMKTEVYKREDIIIPGKESAQDGATPQAQKKKTKITVSSFGISKPDIKIPDIGIDFSKQTTSEQKVSVVKGERTILVQDVTSKTETKKSEGKIEGVITDIKMPGVDNIEYIDSVGAIPTKKDGGIRLSGFGIDIDATKPKADMSSPEIRGEVRDAEAKKHTIKLTKTGLTPDISVNVPDADMDVNIDGAQVKILESEEKGSKFKIPTLGISMPKVKGPKIDVSLSKKDITLPEAKAEVKLPETPGTDITLRNVDVSVPEPMVAIDKPEVEIKPLQIEGEFDGQGSKFKIPKLGIKMPKIKGPELDLRLSKKSGDVTLPESKADGKLPQVPEIDASLGNIDLSLPVQKMEVKTPELEMKPLETEVEFDGQGSKFKMPKLGITMAKVKGPEIDFSLLKKDIDVTLPEAKAGVKVPDTPEVGITLGHTDISMPEKKIEVEKPELEVKPLQTEIDFDGQGSKFKMPKFGIKMPKFKGPEFDVSLSKKDVDVTLPEVKAEGKLPDAPEIVASVGGIDVSIPAQEMDVKQPELEIKPLQTEVEIDGQGSKFKMPKLGITMPKLKGPEFDLSLSRKDADVSLPEAKAEVKLPDAPVADVTLGSVDVSIPEQKVDIKKPELKPLQSETEIDGQGSKFKMPKFGIKMPKMKGPEFDLSLSKKNVDVKLPEVKVEGKIPGAPEIDASLGSIDVSVPGKKIEVDKPEMEVKPLQTEVELDGQGSKFKMPKFGIKMPKIKGPEFDLSLSKKDVDVTLPEVKAEAKLPTAPEIDASLGGVDVSISKPVVEVEKPELEIKPLHTEVELDGQGSKFKMPKFGIKMPKIKGPEFDLSLSKKDVDVKLPEVKVEGKIPEAPEIDASLGRIDVSVPGKKIEVDKPEMEVKPLQTEVELDGQGSKFKMPKFGIKMPKIKGPEFDLSLSKKDVDVTLPEVKAEAKLPTAPEIDASLGGVDVSISKPVVEVEKPEMEIKPLHTEVELDGQGSKFKMPKFGIKMPKIKGPEFDLSLSKKDVDVKLPEVKVEGKLPTAPEVDASVGSIDVSITKPVVEVEKPEFEIKALETEVELDGHGGKFKMPKFGITMPKVKGPEIDFSAQKKEVDLTVPQAEAEVKLPVVELSGPSAKVEVKVPEIKGVERDIDGSPSKFKMPSFKLPKFGASTRSVNVEISGKTKDVQIPETQLKSPEGVAVDITAPSIDVEGPSIDVKTTAAELDGKGGKFKMPKFGISLPKVKSPEMDLSLSKKDIDVTLPEADVKLPDVSEPVVKVEVKAPETAVQQDVEGSPSKFKMPTFKLPKFGMGAQKASVEVPDMDVKIDEADINIPGEGSGITIAAPSIDIEGPSVGLKTTVTEPDGKGSKFKMPHFGFSMPKVKGPKIDSSLSKKDVDITLPEAKVDVRLPEVNLEKGDVSIPGAKIDGPELEAEVKLPKTAVEIKSPVYEAEMDGHGGKFKMPKFGIKMPKVKGPEFDLSLPKKEVDLELPETKADVKLPEIDLGKVEVSIPEAKLEVEKPEVEIQALETEGKLDGQGGKFKMPKFGIKMPKLKGPEFDLSLSKKDVNASLPEVKTEVKLPVAEVEVKAPEIDVPEGSPSKFTMPNFGLSMPKVKGPDIDLNLSKKHTDVTFPDAKAEVKLPEAPKIDVSLGKAEVMIPEAEVEVKKPEMQIRHLQTDVDHEGQGGKFKMPKFGISMPKVKGPQIDLSFSKKDADVTLPEAKVEAEIPEPPTTVVDVKSLECEAEIDGQGSKFKMPKFGIAMPKVKGPEIDLSLSKKDTDVTLPEAEAKLPDVELKDPSAKVEIKASGTVDGHVEGSPSKFKLPTFKLPKFGAATPNVSAEVPDLDKGIKVDGAKDSTNIDIKGPSLDVKMTGTEGEGKGGKFKMPKFGISLPKVQGPEIDLSLPKKDVTVKLPEGKAEVKLPEGPEVDVNLGKINFSIPEATIDVKKPELELQSEGEVDGQGSKLKMPKIGMSMPKVKGPDIDLSLSKKDVEVTLPEGKAEISLPDVEVKEPYAKVEVKTPEIEAQLSSVKESPSKFKLPSFKFPRFGVATPNITAEVPDTDKEITIDGADKHISAPDTDVDIPEVKAEVRLPEVEVKEPSEVVIEQPAGVEVDAKLKKPKFSLPKFSFSKPNVKAPEVAVDPQHITVAIPEGKVEVKGGEVEVKPPEVEADIDGQGTKFKMPKFGITMPKVTGPEIDFSLSKKDVDVTLPEAKAKIKLPEVKVKEPSAEAEVKAPEIKVGGKDTEGSPSKFKMPTLKLPKFGVGTTPEMDKNIKIDGEEEVLAVTIDSEGPSIDMKPAGIEGKGSKFKLPSLGFSAPHVKGPEVDLSSSKKDVDLTLPEVKADIQLPDVELKEPSAKVEMKASEVNIQATHIEGSPSKFKMPTFKLPKFGATTQISVKGPEVDTDIEVDGADLKLPEAKAEVKLPDVQIKTPEASLPEGDANAKKSWTLPKFSFSKTSVKSPEGDVSLDTPKADVTLPEVKAEIHPPDIEIEDAKLKKPKFSLPKFSFSKQSTKELEVDANLPEGDVSLPEVNAEVKLPEVQVKQPEGGVETDGHESRFKMPKFGITMPKVKGPEIDLSLSKKDVDVTSPKVKGEVQLPDVKTKQPSAKVEIKTPEIEAQTGNVEASPSKLKMPTFTLPKFGAATPKLDVQVPDVDKDIKSDGAKVQVAKEGATVDVKGPNIDTEDLTVEGSGTKFKMPKFGITMPKVKGPQIDLSFIETDIDVTASKVKGEVQLPDVKTKQPSAKVEIKAPEIEAQTGNVEVSPSKLKMPTFTLPKFGAATPKVDVQVPDVDKVPKEGVTVDVAGPSIDTEGVSVEGSGSKFKMPKFGITMAKVKGPEIDITLPKTGVDVTLPEAKIEATLPSGDVKEPEGATSVPDTPTAEVDAKMKRSNWTFPKFSFSRTGGKAPDVDVNIETPNADVTTPEASLPNVEVKGPSGVISVEEPSAAELDANLKKTKFSLPKFSFSKTSATVSEVSAEPLQVDVSLPEGQVKVKQPAVEVKAPELEAEHDTQGSKFKFPKFGITLPKAKGPEVDLNASMKDGDATLPEVKAEVKLPEVQVKESSASVETEVKMKDGGGSPLKFKMPTLKMPKLGSASYDVTMEAPHAAKAETEEPKEIIAVNIKGPSIDIKTDTSKTSTLDSETPKTETDGVGQGSPSKFKMPSFKMPKLSFSRSKAEDEQVPAEDESRDDQLKTEGEPQEVTKSPKLTLTSFGEILKNIDVEFDVSKTDKEENLETLKEIQETGEPSGKQLEKKENDTNTKQDTTKSPERTGWFKFPRFGLSSPSEPAKTPEKDEQKDEKSPVGETGDEVSPTSSVHSSDAFADISSAMTSEHVGLSLSSPTKVTVKYTGPDVSSGFGEIHRDIITSTTSTALISVEPNLPEKVTILSSGVSSSSEDTLRLESGKIHVITSNIQATPEAQHAKIVTAVKVQSAGGLTVESEADKAASSTVQESQSSTRSIFGRYFTKETSTEKIESKETIVITKQITRSSEPISGETASSIQRLKDSVHSEKMRFFDGAEK